MPPKQKKIKPKKEVRYLVIGSNNFWYSMDSSLKDAMATVKQIEAEDFEDPSDTFGDPESSNKPFKPNEIFIYKAQQVKRVELSND